MSPTDVAKLALLVSVVTGIISLGSLAVAIGALRLSKRQDERRKPLIIAYLLNAYVHFGKSNDNRVYAFLVSISNPSDIDNSIAHVELSVTYKHADRSTPVTIQIPLLQSLDEAIPQFSDFPSFNTPARLDAHQTLTAWAMFRASESMFKKVAIEGYVVSFRDTHGLTTTFEPITVQEFVDEVISPTP